MMQRVLKVNASDNVVVALQNIAMGDEVGYKGSIYRIVDDIPARHKFFQQDMQVGEAVIMYGVLVGKAQSFIPAGSLMTTTNVKHAAEGYGYRGVKYNWQALDVSKFKDRTFKGYHRSDGRVGTANYWLFIPTVFCENRNLDVIKEALQNELRYAVTHKYKQYAHLLVEAFKKGESIDDTSPLYSFAGEGPGVRLFKNVDGIKFQNHQGGCGGIRQDAAILSKLLASYADHPNVGGITVLSLGCQNLQVEDFKRDLHERNANLNKPLYIFEQQQIGNKELLIQDAIKKTFEGLIEINRIERAPATLDKLTVGVKNSVAAMGLVASLPTLPLVILQTCG